MGVANVENASPRSGSKRSTALSRPERRDLLEVVDRLAPSGEPAGERDRESEVLGDELVAEPSVLRAAVLEEPRQRLVGRVSSSFRHALGEPEPPLTVDDLELVLVDHRRDDRARELGRREANRLRPRSVPSTSIAASRSVNTRFSVDSGRPPVIVKPSSSTAMRRSSRSSKVIPIRLPASAAARRARRRNSGEPGMASWICGCVHGASCLQTGQDGKTEGTMPFTETAETVFPAVPESVGAARRFTRAALGRHDDRSGDHRHRDPPRE